MTTCSPLIGAGRGRGLVAVPPRAGAQQGETSELHQHLREQVSCDWWISGHVTAMITSDWSSTLDEIATLVDEIGLDTLQQQLGLNFDFPSFTS